MFSKFREDEEPFFETAREILKYILRTPKEFVVGKINEQFTNIMRLNRYVHVKTIYCDVMKIM